MAEFVFDANEAPVIRIEHCEDLRIEGRPESQIQVIVDIDEGDDGTSAPTFSDNQLKIGRLHESIQLFVPLGASVHVEEVEGDASVLRIAELRIDDLAGDLRAGEISRSLSVNGIGGDASVTQAGAVSIDSVGGDFRVGEVAGAVSVDSVGGDLRALNLASLSVDSVGGDMRAEDVRGALSVGSVGGDAVLKGSLEGIAAMHVGGDLKLATQWVADRDYRVTVGGDAIITVDEGASLVLSATVGGDVAGVPGAGEGPGVISASWGEG
ncbi:MAG TPA: hypothetical protein VGE07_27805, partial [Herpetosiphonaceae bacterium]